MLTEGVDDFIILLFRFRKQPRDRWLVALESFDWRPDGQYIFQEFFYFSSLQTIYMNYYFRSNSTLLKWN